MWNKYNRSIFFPIDFLKQFNDLFLYRHIKCCRRLIRNQNIRTADHRAGNAKELPLVYDHPFDIQAISVPTYRAFSLKNTLTLEFECSNCAAMAAVSEGVMTAFSQKGPKFSLTFSPGVGTLGIFAKKDKKTRNYSGIIEFEVIDGKKGHTNDPV